MTALAIIPAHIINDRRSLQQGNRHIPVIGKPLTSLRHVSFQLWHLLHIASTTPMGLRQQKRWWLCKRKRDLGNLTQKNIRQRTFKSHKNLICAQFYCMWHVLFGDEKRCAVLHSWGIATFHFFDFQRGFFCDLEVTKIRAWKYFFCDFEIFNFGKLKCA